MSASSEINLSCPEIINPPDDCAVMGIYTPHRTAFEQGFTILTHGVNRGTDSNGFTTLETDGTLYTQKQLGKPCRDGYEARPATMANGHNRYTTTQETNTQNAQPIYAVDGTGEWQASLAHNGNLEREQIAARLKKIPEGTSDSAYMAQLIVESPGATWIEKIRNAFPYLNGSFSSVLLTPEGLYGFCDLRKNRPLWLSAHANGSVVITSETYPVDQLPQGEEYTHTPVDIGEVVHVGIDGEIERIALFEEEERTTRDKAFCLEEIVYLERGESLAEMGEEIAPIDMLRKRAGKQMAREEHMLNFTNGEQIGASAIPRGGTSYTDGYSEESGVDRFALLVKILDERSFISNGDQQGVAKKKLAVDMHELERFALAGKKDLILIDDSLIRGNMIEPTLAMLKQAFIDVGYEVPNIHIRICSPEVFQPCGLGLAIHSKDELFYNRIEDACEALGIASIQHLSTEGILEAFTGQDATEVLSSLGPAYIGLGYCLNCMRKEGFVHPIEWYNRDDELNYSR